MFRVTLPGNPSRAMRPSSAEDCLTVGANVDIGKSRIAPDGLVRIEDERPGAYLVPDGIAPPARLFYAIQK